MGFLRKENMNEQMKEKQYVRVHNYILHGNLQLSRAKKMKFVSQLQYVYTTLDLLANLL